MDMIKKLVEQKKTQFIAIICMVGLLDVFQYRRTWMQLDEIKSYAGIVAVITLLGGNMAIISVSYLVIYRDMKIHHTFLMLSMSMGVCFMVAMPIYTAPDEKAHYDTAYELSNKFLGIEDSDEAGKMIKRKCDDEYYVTYFRENLYGQFEQLQDEKEDQSLVMVQSHSTYKYLSSVFPAIGMTIGRILRLSFSSMAFLGALCNLIFFSCAISYAIKRTPIGKGIFYAVGLLPLTMQQAQSYSYDVAIIVATSMVMALTLDWHFAHKKTTALDVILFVLSGVLLLYLKGGVYAVVLLLPLILAIKKVWINTKKRWILWGAGIVVLIVGVFGVFLLHNTLINMLSTSAYLSYCDEYARPALYYIQHPAVLFEMMIRTIKESGTVYIAQLFGNQLGWLEVTASKKVMLLYLIMIIICMVRGENEKAHLSRGFRVCLLLISVVIIILPIVSMLLYWTPESSGVILGVQGRYFIPAIIPALLALGTWNKPMMGKIQGGVVQILVGISLYASLIVLVRYAVSFA